MYSGEITAIEVQHRNKERVNVFVDGEFAFGLNLLDAARLRVGQVLTEPEITQLRTKDAASQAMDAALNYLAPRPRSRTEITTQLKKKRFEPQVIAEVLERLEELHYVDDHHFAQFWVDNRNAFNQRGKQALRYELRQKGIEINIIEEILVSLDYEELARQAAKKKMRTFRSSDAKTDRIRLGGFLSRRGFDYDTVRKITEEFVTDDMDGDAYEE